MLFQKFIVIFPFSPYFSDTMGMGVLRINPHFHAPPNTKQILFFVFNYNVQAHVEQSRMTVERFSFSFVVLCKSNESIYWGENVLCWSTVAMFSQPSEKKL